MCRNRIIERTFFEEQEEKMMRQKDWITMGPFDCYVVTVLNWINAIMLMKNKFFSSRRMHGKVFSVLVVCWPSNDSRSVYHTRINELIKY